MFYISLISSKVDCKGKQLNSTNIGMREEDEFDDIVHAISIGEGVPDSSLRGKHV